VPDAPSPSSSWAIRAYALTALVAAITGVFLVRIPIQLSDSFTEFLVVQKGSLWQVVASEFGGGPYLRPFRRGIIKIVYDLSFGHYQLAFRGFQVLQLFVLLLLVVRAMRVRTREGLAMVPLTLALVLGVHTMAGAILEGLPVNHFLTILICCAAAINLAQAPPSWRIDVAAVLLMVFSMLTIESGLVVAAVFVAAALAGYRGVSRAALAAVVLCVAVYMAGRFLWLPGTTPGLDERSAGFGFRVLSTAELVARFGDHPLPFYLYNLACAVSSVLLAEPRGGVWEMTRGLVSLHPEPWRVISVASTTSVTLLMAAWAWPRRHRLVRLQCRTDAERLFVVFVCVLPANAVFAYAYEKDAILGPAGLLFALAGAAVVAEIVGSLVSVGKMALPGPAISLLLLVVACGWTVRFVGVHYSLQVRELSVRNEWAYYQDWADRQQFAEPFTPAENAIRDSLRRQAIRGASGVRQVPTRWPSRLFDITQ
jgi:hypothetical protein